MSSLAPLQFDSSISGDRRAIHARWVLPVASPPISNGVVVVKGGRIESVGDRSLLSGFSDEEIVALPDAALLPGLVNAHTHLEFSGCPAPLGEPGDSFAAWLHEVISRRRESFAAETDELRAQRRRESVASGVAESRTASVAALGDIATPGWTADVLPSPHDLQVVVFLELLGLGPDRTAMLQAAAREHLTCSSGRIGKNQSHDTSDSVTPTSRSGETRDSLIRGLSPHAPYTVSPDLVAWAASISAETGAPLAMHLAESFDEYELISAHSGQLVDVLREFGAWHPAAVPRGIRWRDYLELLAHAARTLVVHGNFLGPDDWRLLADQRDTMSVVYCPRTHARFRHGAYPLAEMLAAGVRVAVGTDSRATNPDLQLWQDLRFAAAAHPSVPAEQILKLGTLAAAEALGLQADYGSIATGRRARFVVVKTDSVAEADTTLITTALIKSGP